MRTLARQEHKTVAQLHSIGDFYAIHNRCRQFYGSGILQQDTIFVAQIDILFVGSAGIESTCTVLAALVGNHKSQLGINVVDLGVDVSAEKFVEEAIANNAQIICCSALLTTTMNEMENVVKVATEKGIRENVFIMVGGAPITQEYCDKIGADCYTTDAASASDEAIAYLRK